MKFSVLYLIAILLIGGCSSLESVTSNFLSKIPQSSKESYDVKSGDSIWSIALQYNLDPETIICSELTTALLAESASKYIFCPGTIVKGFKRLLLLMIIFGS